MSAGAVVPRRAMSHGHPGHRISPEVLAAAARVAAYAERRRTLAVAAFEADAAAAAKLAAASALLATSPDEQAWPCGLPTLRPQACA